MPVAQITSPLAILNSTESLPVLARWSLVFAATVTTWDKRRRSRKDLRKLPPELLHDIGLDRMSAHAEATKPFWQD